MGKGRRNTAAVPRGPADTVQLVVPTRLSGAVGWLLLLMAGGVSIVLPPGWMAILLAAAAFVAFARDPRLGPLPAGLAVILALPYDRAANSYLLHLAGVPVRPQDAVMVMALVMGGASATWRLPRRPIVFAMGAFLSLGLIALVVGVVGGNDPHDVLRDARWWFLYGAGLVALLWDVPRQAIFRGLLVGMTVFALVAVATVLLPAFDGGLKERALIYDRGTLRMQFGNSIFLLPAAALAVHSFVRRGSRRNAVAALLFLVAVALSLTRTFLGVAAMTVVAAGAWSAIRAYGPKRTIASIGAVLLVVAVCVGGGVALVSVQAPARDSLSSAGASPGGEGDQPVDRLLFRGARSTLGGAVTGRLTEYANAIGSVSHSGVLGGGLGTLVDAKQTFGGEAFHTPGKLPNVDNASLTVGLKAGVPGIAVFLTMLLWPVVVMIHGRLRRLTPWFMPAWLGVLALTMTQSFAAIGYSPYGLSLLLAVTGLGYAASSEARARSHV